MTEPTTQTEPTYSESEPTMTEPTTQQDRAAYAAAVAGYLQNAAEPDSQFWSAEESAEDLQSAAESYADSEWKAYRIEPERFDFDWRGETLRVDYSNSYFVLADRMVRAIADTGEFVDRSTVEWCESAATTGIAHRVEDESLWEESVPSESDALEPTGEPEASPSTTEPERQADSSERWTVALGDDSEPADEWSSYYEPEPEPEPVPSEYEVTLSDGTKFYNYGASVRVEQMVSGSTLLRLILTNHSRSISSCLGIHNARKLASQILQITDPAN